MLKKMGKLHANFAGYSRRQQGVFSLYAEFHFACLVSIETRKGEAQII